MSPSAEAPNDSISPDLESSISDFFANPGTPEASPSTATETPDAAPAEEAQPAEPEQPQPEAAKPPTEEGQEPELAGDVDEEDIDLAALEAGPGKNVRIDKSRFRNIYQNHKMAREIQQFAPSVEAARGHYERANDLRNMYEDFTSGAPEGADKFLNFWRGQNPEAFSTLASRALNLAPQNVQDQVRETMVQRTVDDAYQAAVSSGDPQDMYRAQMMDWTLTGKYKAKDAIPRPDPMAQERTRLEKLQQELDGRQKQEQESRWTTWTGVTNNTISDSLNNAIAEHLKPLEQAGYDARVLKALATDVRNEVINGIKKDQEWVREFNMDMNGARPHLSDLSKSQANRQALVDFYMSRAAPLVRAAVKPLANKATQTALKQNQSAHDARAKSQDRREVTSGGRPSPTRAAPATAGGSLDDQMGAFWREQDAALRRG